MLPVISFFKDTKASLANNSFYHIIPNADGKVPEVIQTLFQLTGIAVPEDADFSTIVTLTQAAWKQKKERWELKGKYSETQAAQILNCFKESSLKIIKTYSQSSYIL